MARHFQYDDFERAENPQQAQTVNTDGEFSAFENRLRQLRPRAAVLDLGEIECRIAAVAGTASSSNRYRPGRLQVMSVAAAWLIGIGFGILLMSLSAGIKGEQRSEGTWLTQYAPPSDGLRDHSAQPSGEEPAHSVAVTAQIPSDGLDQVKPAPQWGTIAVEQWFSLDRTADNETQLRRKSRLRPNDFDKQEVLSQTELLSRPNGARPPIDTLPLPPGRYWMWERLSEPITVWN